jgi:hypothetical protein
VKKLIIGLLISSLLLSGCGPLRKIIAYLPIVHHATEDPGITAKQWLSFAEDVAKHWRSDVYLIGILDSRVDSEGKSQIWNYLFYSEAGDKAVQVNYDHGFINIVEKEVTPLAQIKDWKIDSPIAVKLAVLDGGGEKFIQENGLNSITAALISSERNKKDVVFWAIRFYSDKDLLEVLIDANNGKII